MKRLTILTAFLLICCSAVSAISIDSLNYGIFGKETLSHPAKTAQPIVFKII
jgi:hypothetical protein